MTEEEEQQRYLELLQKKKALLEQQQSAPAPEVEPERQPMPADAGFLETFGGAIAGTAKDTVGLGENLLDAGANLVGDVVSNVQKIGDAYVKGQRLLRQPFTGSMGEPSEEEVIQRQKDVRKFFDYEPRTESGKRLQEMAKNGIAAAIDGSGAGGALQAIGNSINAFKDSVEEKTGSRVMAEASVAAPELLIDVIPAMLPVKFAKTAKNVTPKDIRNSQLEVGDNLQKMTEIRNQLYAEFDQKGVALKGGTIAKAADYIEAQLLDSGIAVKELGLGNQLDAIRRNNPIIRDQQGSLPSVRKERIGKLEDTKKFLYQGYASKTPEQRFAIDSAARSLDAFTYNLTKGQGLLNVSASEIDGKTLRKMFGTARELSGRVIRSENIKLASYYASLKDTPKGTIDEFKKGINSILRKPQQRKFYGKAEIGAMEDLLRGKPLLDERNFLKMMGSLGIKATPVGAVIGLARVYRAFGSTRVRQMPIVGPARVLADTLTGETKIQNKAAKSIVAKIQGGARGEEVVTQYLKSVPKGKRDPMMLAEFLADPRIKLNDIKLRGSKLEKEAIEIANGIRARRVILAAPLTQNEEDE